MTRRATDRQGRARTAWIWWQRIGSTLATTAAVGVAFYSVYLTQVEGRERRDQSCRIDESKQKNDVRALGQTYGYLDREFRAGHSLTGGLNREVLAALPRVLADAQEDDAPAFCDERGVGLPEPDPVLPLPPPWLTAAQFPKGNLP